MLALQYLRNTKIGTLVYTVPSATDFLARHRFTVVERLRGSFRNCVMMFRKPESLKNGEVRSALVLAGHPPRDPAPRSPRRNKQGAPSSTPPRRFYHGPAPPPPPQRPDERPGSSHRRAAPVTLSAPTEHVTVPLHSAENVVGCSAHGLRCGSPPATRASGVFYVKTPHRELCDGLVSSMSQQAVPDAAASITAHRRDRNAHCCHLENQDSASYSGSRTTKVLAPERDGIQPSPSVEAFTPGHSTTQSLTEELAERQRSIQVMEALWQSQRGLNRIPSPAGGSQENGDWPLKPPEPQALPFSSPLSSLSNRSSEISWSLSSRSSQGSLGSRASERTWERRRRRKYFTQDQYSLRQPGGDEKLAHSNEQEKHIIAAKRVPGEGDVVHERYNTSASRSAQKMPGAWPVTEDDEWHAHGTETSRPQDADETLEGEMQGQRKKRKRGFSIGDEDTLEEKPPQPQQPRPEPEAAPADGTGILQTRCRLPSEQTHQEGGNQDGEEEEPKELHEDMMWGRAGSFEGVNSLGGVGGGSRTVYKHKKKLKDKKKQRVRTL
ncbi:hypothetical protein VTJ83DRAFT_2682 [Remersonia thermophila]|uniref:Uncharacterized protein n=1 Tax=Remersonia thermophila TaxID=72144 RepID=A0ABR4DJH4_9PEZI